MGGGTGYAGFSIKESELRRDLVDEIIRSAIYTDNASGTADNIRRIEHFKFTGKDLSKILERFTYFYTKPDGMDNEGKEVRALLVERNFAICVITEALIKTQELNPYHTSLIMGFENSSLNVLLVKHNWETLAPLSRKVITANGSAKLLRTVAKINSDSSHL